MKMMRVLLMGVALFGLLGSGLGWAQTATDLNCNGCVDSKDIADRAVRRSNIANFAVNTPKLNNFAVTSEKIKTGAVNESKIQAGAVTMSKLGFDVLSTLSGIVVLDWVLFDFPTGGTNIHSVCNGAKYVKQSNFHPFFYVGAQLCSNFRYKLFMATSPGGIYWEIADTGGIGEDHCELIGGTGTTAIGTINTSQPTPSGFWRNGLGQAFQFDPVPGNAFRTDWYECGIAIP